MRKKIFVINNIIKTASLTLAGDNRDRILVPNCRPNNTRTNDPLIPGIIIVEAAKKEDTIKYRFDNPRASTQ